MIKQMITKTSKIKTRFACVLFFPLFLLFSGCEDTDISREDFAKFSEGTFNTKLITNEEGTRAVEVVTFDVGRDHPILGVTLNIDGEKIGRTRYELPKKVSVQNGKIKIPFSSKISGSGFVRIKGEGFFLGDVYFMVKQDQASGELSLGIEKLVFWKTGFTLPSFKKKYTLNF